MLLYQETVQGCVDLPGNMIVFCRRDIRAVVPNLFGTRDRFCGRQFFHGLGVRGTVSG